MTVLEGLLYIKENLDSTLALPHFLPHGRLWFMRNADKWIPPTWLATRRSRNSIPTG